MRIVGQLFATLVVVGFVCKFWWLLALVVAVCLYAPQVWARHQAAVAAERRRLAAIVARADQQHAWARAGDPRGTYGEDFALRVEPDRRRAGTAPGNGRT
jgi:hypothetical protein